MEFKAPANHRPLLLLLCLLLLLILAYIPFTMAQTINMQHHEPFEYDEDAGDFEPPVPNQDQTKPGPRHGHEGDKLDPNMVAAPAPALNEQLEQTKKGEHSVEENNAQSLLNQSCPSCCECPQTLEPEALKELKNNLGPVIRQQLVELLEKTRTVESAFEVVHTIDMLKLLDESNSEFNIVRENMHDGAQRLRDAYHKLGKKLQPQYVS